jgi:hypothetical protein
VILEGGAEAVSELLADVRRRRRRRLRRRLHLDEDAVGADVEVAVADAFDEGRRQARDDAFGAGCAERRDVVPLEDDVVVAEALVLAESHRRARLSWRP